MIRKIAKTAMIFLFTTQVLADEGMAKSPKDQPRPVTVKGSQGGVSGDPCTNSTDSCCESHPTPGCEDPACCNSVCAVPGLESCCQDEWNFACAFNAFQFCGAKCEMEVCADATGSCCEAHPTPGCEDPTCCDSVCGVPGLEYCCQTEWDAQCVASAFFYCGDKCEREVCSDATGSCCESHPTPGCEVPTCCDSVCGVPGLEYCCQTEWDAQCVANAFFYCGDKCEMEVCADATGSCCESHPTPGCEDPSCCNTVCSVPGLEYCCQSGWDVQCTAIAFFICGDKCEMEVCADATGSCCEAHATPGCEDPTCCNAVCAADTGLAYCCQTVWDASCAANAELVCGTLCTGACCEPNEPNGCRQSTPFDCTAVGAFQGLGTECEPEQACCLGNGTCENLAPVCCAAQGGTPSGAATSCAGNCCTDADCPPDPNKCFDSFCDLTDHACKEVYIPECRVSASEKGSLLFFSKIELKWQAVPAPAPPGGFNLTQDTFLTIVNDWPADVYVQWYFINGDAPLAPQFTGNPPVLVERGHPGWNWVDCNTYLTHDESNYWSAATGSPLGCQPFGILDPGTPPGRPDPEGPAGSRVLRGYAIAFAVDSAGNEISWNHLSGSVAIVNYADRSAWEYNAYGIQCVADVAQGSECRELNGRGGAAGALSSSLNLNGKEYDFAFDKLLFDFYAVGSQAFNQGLNIVTLDTDLTLYPVDVDLRQDNDGPITTKAKFDIWNQNEDGFSGTTRCITCWDQTLLSSYGSLSNFMLGVLHTDKGKARIDGIPSDVCDPPGACCDLATDIDCFPATEHPFIDLDCSVKAALLGVSDKILVFSGATTGRTDAGMTLVGQGEQSAVIRRDLIQPPDPLTTAPEAPEAQSATGLDDASPIPVRAPNQSRLRLRSDKE